MFKDKNQVFSFRKYKAYGLASAVIGSMFLANGVVSADVVTSPDGTKTTLSNDKASVTVDANHFKDSNDKSAKELYDAKEYEADKVTTGKDTVNDESKTVVSYETEDGTKLKDNVTKTATEEKQLNYKIEGVSGKEYTGTTSTTPVNANLEKQDTIEKDGEKYKYVRTETKAGKNTNLTNTTFNDVTAKASVEGMYNEDGSIKYDKIKNGSRVWVLEEKEDGTYGNYALIENAQDLSDEKIQEAAKKATTKFSKAEVEKLGGIKDTDSIVVYETNTYAARKQTTEQFGKDYYFDHTASNSNFHKSYIDEIYKVGLTGLEKRGDSYFYNGKEVITIDDFKKHPHLSNDGTIDWYATDEDHKYYFKGLGNLGTDATGSYALPTTYYDVLSDFLITHPDSPIFANQLDKVFWTPEEQNYFAHSFVMRLINTAFNSKYNLTIDTNNFTDKPIETKADVDGRPTEKKTYSFNKTELNGDAEDTVSAWNNNEVDMWKNEIGISYSAENVEKVRNWIKGYQSLSGWTIADPFRGKSASDVTKEEYINTVFNEIANQYSTTLKDLFTTDEIKRLRSTFGSSPFMLVGSQVSNDNAETDKEPSYSFSANSPMILRNSLGIVTENTETFTYHDVITPLRAYRLNADTNTVRHVYEKVKRGSVIATHKDTQGNELLPQESIKTNEFDGEAYTTSSKEIPAKIVTDTTPEGFTRTTTTTYQLVETPSNKDGNVVGGETITVPYVYKPTKDIRINGSVIATYTTEDGEKLTDDVAVKTNAPEQEAYTTSVKDFESKTETSDVNGLTKTTVTRYELIEEPSNKDGKVIGNQTITAPYVYRKVVTETINGSVIATYKDTEGNVLAPQESVKTNVPDKEAYTTAAKVIPDVVTTDTDENGFTRKTTKVYTLVETPKNQNGSVVGGTVTTVPYVYNVKTIVETNGSVIATHKDTEGNELAPQESIKTNEPNGTSYTTSSKEIPEKVEIDQTDKGLTRVTTTRYELVENPSNKDGNVVGGETITVPYVYKPVKSVQVNGSVIATYTTEDGEKLAEDVAVKTDAPSDEAYTTERKTFDSVTKEDDVNGFTRLTTTRYELIETPTNADGNVEADKVITVPYVYRKVITVNIKGSVISTYKDEEGNILASEEKVATNENAGEYYAAVAKQIQASTSTRITENGKEITVITYELIKTPDNETGEVVGGETLVVPYVYRKVEKVHLIPNNPPVVEDETIKVTRFHSDTGEELQSSVTGFEAAPKIIGNYQFTGTTEINEGNDVQTHIYTKIVTEIPNEAPKVENVEAKVTRYMLKDRETEIANWKQGLEDADPIIGEYQFTGVTEHNESGDVRTHIYTKIITEIPNEAPKVEKEEAKVTRFHSDTGEELQSSVTRFEAAPKTIGNYQFTGTTEMNEGNDVQTHIYTKIVTEIPNDAPKVEKNELKFTRFMLEDRKTEIKDMVEGFVEPTKVIGNYTYTGVTDSDEGGAVITHIYKPVDVSELPKDAPKHDKPEFNDGAIPNDAPIHDKPEFNGGVIPNDAPVHDKPEFNGGAVPNEAPVHDKPEFNGGVIPNDAPVHDKPEFNGGVIPNDAPVHDKPEYNGGVIPNDAPVHDKPEFNGGAVPNEAPVHEKPELKIPEQPTETPVVPETPTPKSQEKRQEQFMTKELPNTGTEASLLGLVGLATAIGSIGLLKLKKEDSE